jgi:hypothetical protein
MTVVLSILLKGGFEIIGSAEEAEVNEFIAKPSKGSLSLEKVKRICSIAINTSNGPQRVFSLEPLLSSNETIASMELLGVDIYVIVPPSKKVEEQYLKVFSKIVIADANSIPTKSSKH